MNHDDTKSDDQRREEELAFTVATVWRDERVSCPHLDILRAWLGGALTGGAAGFVGVPRLGTPRGWLAAADSE